MTGKLLFGEPIPDPDIPKDFLDFDQDVNKKRSSSLDIVQEVIDENDIELIAKNAKKAEELKFDKYYYTMIGKRSKMYMNEHSRVGKKY